jgi:putative protein-disulfide isomerase
MPNKTLLYYGHDPMCSFCWAFGPTWTKIKSKLAENSPEIEIVYVMGGLAPDSDEPMPEELRSKLSATWRYIEQHIPGTQFNFDFWSQQQPRRSTYPACRAVIAAKMLKPELEDAMILAIQHAYYLNAQNPSNQDTLIQCAESIGLDKPLFAKALRSAECDKAFTEERMLSRSLGIYSFPSLVITRGNSRFNVPVDYNNAPGVLERLYEMAALV